MPRVKLQNDTYNKARGGSSRLLDISCAKCGGHICSYQKDGSGHLKRMYVDRMSGLEFEVTDNLRCSGCQELLGMAMIYKKEERAAYRLLPGAVAKKISRL